MDIRKYLRDSWLIVLLFNQSGCDWLNCAHIVKCQCKWSSGKKTASCTSADLTYLPRLASDIQVLDLHGNPLKVLKEDAFVEIDLLNIQRLNLSDAKLRRIHRNTFRELRILIELDISNNELHHLSPDVFKGLYRLRLLVLNNNPLNELIYEQFPPLHYLKKLEISMCHLKSVHPLAFTNLRALETIYAHQNLLSHVHPNTFNLPFLKTLKLSENPWYCDCRLREFHEWFLNANLGSEDVLCAGPGTHARKSWRSIKGNELVCPPLAITTPSVLRAEVGSKISFGCFATGDPKPKVTWYFKQTEIKNITTDKTIINVSKHERNYSKIQFDKYNDDLLEKCSQWVNVSVTNITEQFSGEWTCHADSSVGEMRAYLTLVLATAHTATARSAPEFSAIILLTATVTILAGTGFAVCLCWKRRRRRLQSRKSFTEQENKLLESSLAASSDRQSVDMNSSCDYEMFDRSLSLNSEDMQNCFETIHINFDTSGIFPPPPVEFAFPATYGNVFISVQLSDKSNEYPNMLEEKTARHPSITCFLESVNDNMGPRVTAAGSSTWSMPRTIETSSIVDKNLMKPFSILSSEFTAL